jgi:Methyltransferase domain
VSTRAAAVPVVSLTLDLPPPSNSLPASAGSPVGLRAAAQSGNAPGGVYGAREPMTDRANDDFPPGFFARADETDDAAFYAMPRFVTHIDDGAIDAVGALYEQLAIGGNVLDLMSSWVSHFRTRPDALTVLGMNADELAANPHASASVVHDLNADPALPFADDTFDHATCCVSVDYLTQPIEVFREVARVVRRGGLFVCTFSNRLFPTKAIRGWLMTDDESHQRIVAEYFRRAGGFEPAVARACAPSGRGTDPLFAVWAAVH